MGDRESREVLCPTTIVSFVPSLLCPKPPQPPPPPPRRKERRVFLNPSGERARLSSSGTSGGRTDHRLLNVTIRPEMRGRRRSDRHQMMGETEKAGASMSIRFFHCSFFFTRWMDGWRCPFSPLIIALYNLEKWTPVLQ